MRFKQNFSLYPRRNKNKTIWYYRTYDAEGKRTTGTSTGLSSRAKAQAFCEKLFSEGLLISSSHENKPLKLFISDFFGDESNYVQNKLLQNQLSLEQFANSTLKTYRSYFKKYIFPYWENIQVKNITLKEVKTFREYVAESGIKRSSINFCITVLSIIFTDLLDAETITDNPCKKIKPLKETDSEKVGAFNLDEIKLFCNSSFEYSELSLVFIICSLTGMRINEVIGLQKKNIFPDHIKVNVQKQGTGEKSVKDEQPRIIPIIPELYELLMKNIKSSGYIVTQSYNHVYQKFRAACISLGIEERREKDNLHIHSFRHFYNTFLLSENIPGVKVDAILGHKDKERTMQRIYTNWEPAHFNDVQEVNKKLWNIIFN